MSALALQWGLDQTVQGTFEIVRKAIEISTKDDVQPIIFLACPKFGAGLAISIGARDNLYRIIQASAEPVHVQWLKAVIHYSQNDSLNLLGGDLGGQNFLVLASMLISTMTTFDAGNVMGRLMDSSAQDKRFVPAPKQLKDLFDLIEPKLNRTGFLDLVLRWRNRWMTDMTGSDKDRGLLSAAGDSFPNADGIQTLVDAFAIVGRVGNSDAKRVVITARACVPWLTAFTEWSMGVSPVRHTTDGKVFASDPTSPVTIIFATGQQFKNLDIKIDVMSSNDVFTEAVYAQAADPRRFPGAVGMVSIGAYADHILQKQGLDTGLGKRMLDDVLPYALKKVRESFTPGISIGSIPPFCVRGNPFPAEHIISEAAAVYLGRDKAELKLKALGEGSRISDRPISKTWLEENLGKGLAAVISPIVADILAFSLFEPCSSSMQFYYRRNRTINSQSIQDWQSTVETILSIPNYKEEDIKLIISFALGLLGHEVPPKDWEWVASSFRGQVVFPRIFDEKALPKEGYLGLVCFPGTLEPKEGRGKSYKLIRPQEPHIVHEAIPDNITRVVNLYSDYELLWHTTPHDTHVEIGIGWTKNGAALNPFDMLSSLAYTLFATCEHNPSTTLKDSVSTGYQCRSPVDDLFRGISLEESEITVFPVADSPGLRMLALSSVAWRLERRHDGDPLVVVNEGACLDCLISFCHRSGSRCLIL